MKPVLTLVILMMIISGCKVSYQKSYVTEGNSTTSAGITLNAKVCLESAFDNDVAGVEMITDLNVLDLIPTETPYGMSPWFHSSYNDYTLEADILDPDLNPGTADEIFVDWVLVEVYKDINGTMTFMDAQSGLIHFNGTIYDSSGYQGIVFPELEAGNYYVNIKHRNHLPIGSENPIALSDSFDSNTYNIDFTSAAAGNEYLDEGTLIPVPFVIPGASAKCMRAGNINGDLNIDAADETDFATSIAAVVSGPLDNTALLGYLNTDVNFDGVSQRYTDHPGVTESDDLVQIQLNNIIPTAGSIHGD